MRISDWSSDVCSSDLLVVAVNSFHQTYDLLVTPSLPIPAFAAGEEVPAGSDLQRWPQWTPFSYPFNLTQQPAISLPCGLTSEGLPAGLQIVGPRFADALVLRSEEHTSELQSLMRISYAVFCLKKKKT